MKSKLSILLFILSFFCFKDIQAQLSKKHFIPPITSDDPIANQYIYISTPKNKNVSFKIIPVGRPATEEISGIVSNSTPFKTTSFAVGNQLFQESSQTATIINNKGYIVKADDVVYVSVRMRSSNTFQAAAIVSKGNSALGFISTWLSPNKRNFAPNLKSDILFFFYVCKRLIKYPLKLNNPLLFSKKASFIPLLFPN